MIPRSRCLRISANASAGPVPMITYLGIAAELFADANVEVWANCLMPNHVHLIATPSDPEGLAAAVGATHLRYTRRINPSAPTAMRVMSFASIQ